jgi:hypothetical protein
MWDQDWKCAGLRIKKGKACLKPEEEEPVETGNDGSGPDKAAELKRLRRKFGPVLEMADSLYKKQPKVPGYPGKIINVSVSLATASVFLQVN